jgi:hypothetical protein
MPLPFGRFSNTSLRFSRKYLYWPQDFNGDFQPLEGSFVSQTFDLRWDITGVSTFVSQTFDLRWNINNFIAQTYDLRWTILEAADLRITRSNIIVLEEGATSGERQTQVTYASMMVITGVTDALPAPPAGGRLIMNT